jgi:hypothetical protein
MNQNPNVMKHLTQWTPEQLGTYNQAGLMNEKDWYSTYMPDYSAANYPKLVPYYPTECKALFRRVLDLLYPFRPWRVSGPEAAAFHIVTVLISFMALMTRSFVIPCRGRLYRPQDQPQAPGAWKRRYL